MCKNDAKCAKIEDRIMKTVIIFVIAGSNNGKIVNKSADFPLNRTGLMQASQHCHPTAFSK